MLNLSFFPPFAWPLLEEAVSQSKDSGFVYVFSFLLSSPPFGVKGRYHDGYSFDVFILTFIQSVNTV